jgi:BirA family transcriptional regulator, biotin operon repressor / biotin---[acetyl-CoA-carboxylase] ligase
MARAVKPASLAQQLFATLGDGGLHSGEQLAAKLGVTRSAIWKGIENLRRLGLVIRATRNKGYRFDAPLTPLNAKRIGELVPAQIRRVMRRIDVTWSIASTNAELLSRVELPLGQCEVVLAEHQSAGRGRRARLWYAAPGSSLCLSASWLFPALPADSGALSLAVGVAVLRALRQLPVSPVQLKWPNDLVVAGRKLGGILIELRAEAGGPAYVVVGIGMNVALPESLRGAILASGTASIDLAGLGAAVVDRNRLAALLLGELVTCLQVFEREGFAPFNEEWQAADALAGQQVTLSGPGLAQSGRAVGIERNGALRLQTANGIVSVVSGEVSLRAAT